MENSAIDKTSPASVWPRFLGVAIATVLFLGISHFGVAAQVDPPSETEEPVEGQIWNVADTPFTFQLHRAAGNKWTEDITLGPGESRAVLASDTELLGIANDEKQDGYVIIRYQALGGHIQVMLSARTRKDRFLPYWFHAKDSNGISRMIQSASREQAEIAQAKLLEQPPMSADEIEQLKRTLRANWVLYD